MFLFDDLYPVSVFDGHKSSCRRNSDIPSCYGAYSRLNNLQKTELV